MKLSIITINLNNAAGLLQTIESVVKQSFSDFEYIIIDGGSTDNSIGIIKSHSQYLSYWISESDHGIYPAMNKGIRHAVGEYLLFLNSGDFLINSEVLTQVFQIGFSEDIAVGECNISKNQKVIVHAVPPDSITLQAFIGQTIPHQSAFIRLDLFKLLGYYPEQYRIHSDLAFFINALIINNCSYLHLPYTISDYNLEGFSSNSDNKKLSDEEWSAILKSMIPARILKDYELWAVGREEMSILNWLKTKKVLYKPTIMIYSLATVISRWKKKLKN